jgi:hypothetical protein
MSHVGKSVSETMKEKKLLTPRRVLSLSETSRSSSYYSKVVFNPLLVGNSSVSSRSGDRRPAADIGCRYTLIEGTAAGRGAFNSFCSCCCHPSPKGVSTIQVNNRSASHKFLPLFNTILRFFSLVMSTSHPCHCPCNLPRRHRP